MDFLCRIGLMYISTELLGSCFMYKYVLKVEYYSHYVYMSFDKIGVHLVSDFTIILPTSQYIGGNKQMGGAT